MAAAQGVPAAIELMGSSSGLGSHLSRGDLVDSSSVVATPLDSLSSGMVAEAFESAPDHAGSASSGLRSLGLHLQRQRH